MLMHCGDEPVILQSLPEGEAHSIEAKQLLAVYDSAEI